jgi:FkbM family methyltransferase
MSMEALVDWIGNLDGPAPSLVVHVGAGNGAAAGLWRALPQARRPQRVVLVEGDPDAARSLEREAGAAEWMQVLATAVAPNSGRLSWHRFSLASLNGPLDATGLAPYYPRLHQLSLIDIDAIAFADLLRQQLARIPDDDGPAVLILDVPGQEAGLLQSLPDDLLRRFSAIALRGCKEVPGPGGTALASTVAALQTRLFTMVRSERDHEPLWPTACLQFDHRAFELLTLRAVLAERDAEVAAREAEVAELSKSRAWHSRMAKEHEAHAGTLAEEKAALLAKLRACGEELDNTRAELSRTARERDAVGRELRGASRLAEEQQSRAAQLMQEAAALRAEVDTLQAQNDTAKRIGKEQQAQIDALTTELAALHGQMRQSSAEVDGLRAELAKAVREGEARGLELQAAAAKADEHQHLAEQRARELETLREEAARHKSQSDETQKASGDYKRSLAAARTQVAVKQRRVEELEAEMQRMRSTQGALDDELARAEGQLDLIKDLLQLSRQSQTA